MTCDVISDLQVKFLTLFGKFAYRVIEWRLKFGNRPVNLRDQRGLRVPLSRRCYQPDPIGARAKVRVGTKWAQLFQLA